MDLPTLRDERVTLRPLHDGDLDDLVAILEQPAVRRWWDSDEGEARRDGLRNDGSAWTIEVDGALGGWLGLTEQQEPDYRNASLDIFLAPAVHGRGLGPAALRLAISWLFAKRGHHRVTIDPACANERAIRAYRAVGFKPVGVMRRYERGRDGDWHDNLLMDLLAEELQ